MRIAILTCVYPPYGGGIGYVAAAHARELSREHEVTVFTPRYGAGRRFAPSPGVKVVPLRPFGAFGNAALLPQLMWKLRKFDVVHLHYPFLGVHEFVLLALRSSQKLVVTYHMAPQAPGVKGFVLAALTRIAERRLGHRAQALFTQTRDYLEQVAKPRVGGGEKWHVLPLGVGEVFTPGLPTAALQRELKVRYGEQVLLFVGTLDAAHAFKGMEVLLQALTRLKHVPVRLVVVGRGNLQLRYERRARELGLGKRVNFCGYVPDEALVGYLRLASALVLPSTSGAETFGLVLLQAMAVGVPVVASGLPGVRELVGESGAGLLVTPNDPLALAATLEHVLTLPAEARQMGERGLTAVREHYRWSVVGERLREFYRTEL